MKRPSTRNVITAGLAVVAALVASQIVSRIFPTQARFGGTVSVTIDYPVEGAVFPPELPAPTWLWRDAGDQAAWWEINITFSDSRASAG